MAAVFFTAFFTFLIASLFGYFVHKSLHQSWTGQFHNAHMTHHLKLYSPTNYSSDKYRHAGKDNTVLIFGVAAIPLVATPVVLGILHVMPWTLSITALMVMMVMSFLHSYLHDAFHIRNHWLYRVPLINKSFKRWVHIHLLHHVDMSKNYGIFLFFLDKWFGTYWLE